MSTEEANHLSASLAQADENALQTIDYSDAGMSWLHLILVVALVCALALGPIILLAQLAPAGPWRLMPVFALFIAVESVLTRRWLDWPTPRRQRQAYTAAELVFLLALAPLFLWLDAGELPLPASAAALIEDPLAMFNIELLLYMLLALFVWARAHRWSGLLLQLSITADEIKYYASTPMERLADRSILLPAKHRTEILNVFVRGWIAWAIFLVLVAALSTIDLRLAIGFNEAAEGPRRLIHLGLKQDLLFAMMIYFLGGLWLISQARSVVLKGRWLADQSQRDPSVVVKWRRWAILSIVALALIASLLPVGSTLPLLQLLKAVARVVTDLVSAILALVLSVFYFLFSLLPDAEVPEQPPPPADLGQLFNNNPLPESSTDLVPPLLAGSFFWLAIIAVTILATIYFMKDRGPDVSYSWLSAILRRFAAWLRGLGRGASDLAAGLVSPLRLRPRRPSIIDTARSPFRSLRAGSLSPRERVRLLYLSFVRYAAKHGHERPPASTPREFTARLKKEWLDAAEDIDVLTESFVAARYTAHEIDEKRLQSAESAWSHIQHYDPRQTTPQESEDET